MFNNPYVKLIYVPSASSNAAKDSQPNMSHGGKDVMSDGSAPPWDSLSFEKQMNKHRANACDLMRSAMRPDNSLDALTKGQQP